MTVTSSSQASFRIPATGSSSRGAPEKQPALSRPDGSPLRVLVVDDESSLADLLSLALRYEGWDIRSEGDGAERCAVPVVGGRMRCCSM